MKKYTCTVITDVLIPSIYTCRVTAMNDSDAIRQVKHIHHSLRTPEDKLNKIFNIKQIKLNTL